MVPILINKDVFEPSYNDLKFTTWNRNYICTSVVILYLIYLHASHIKHWAVLSVSWRCMLLCVCVHAQLCPTLCDPLDCSPPDSSVHEIFQARIPEWVAISFSRGSFQPRDQTLISCTSRWILYHWATREAQSNYCAKSLQSCLTLCDPVDCSPPDSSVRGILQARILEWVAISFSNSNYLGSLIL